MWQRSDEEMFGEELFLAGEKVPPRAKPHRRSERPAGDPPGTRRYAPRKSGRQGSLLYPGPNLGPSCRQQRLPPASKPSSNRDPPLQL